MQLCLAEVASTLEFVKLTFIRLLDPLNLLARGQVLGFFL